MVMMRDFQSGDRGSIPLTVSAWWLAPNQFQEEQSMLIWSNGRIPHCLWGDQGSIPCINECILLKQYDLLVRSDHLVSCANLAVPGSIQSTH